MKVQAKSKGTWGIRVDRSRQELNAICGAFFDGLQVPKEWKIVRWDKTMDLSPCPLSRGEGNETEHAPSLQITSIGIIFMDTRTRGIDIMHYRVSFHTYSERGCIVEKAMVDYGKSKYTCMGHGIYTVDELNEFIHERYFELIVNN